MSLITQGLGPEDPPLQFLMRAKHTTSPVGFVYWTVNNAPDVAALFAPYPSGQLIDIITAFAFPPTAGEI